MRTPWCLSVPAPDVPLVGRGHDSAKRRSNGSATSVAPHEQRELFRRC